MTRRKRRIFTDQFKKQMVDLYHAGKPRSEIIKEYDLTPSALDKWIKNHDKTGSFKHADNLSNIEKENILLKKELRQARMEVDILKQAALIMGQKSK